MASSTQTLLPPASTPPAQAPAIAPWVLRVATVTPASTRPTVPVPRKRVRSKS